MASNFLNIHIAWLTTSLPTQLAVSCLASHGMRSQLLPIQ